MKGVMDMAASSMTSSACIAGRNQVKKFIEALERAEGNRGKPVRLTRTIKAVSDGELKEIVGRFKV